MIRKLATTIALGAAIALSFLPAVSMAYPPVGWERIYYAEAEHVTAVGGMTRTCPGYVNLWGVHTDYYTETTFPCE